MARLLSRPSKPLILAIGNVKSSVDTNSCEKSVDVTVVNYPSKFWFVKNRHLTGDNDIL
jgi:hypothetical protein